MQNIEQVQVPGSLFELYRFTVPFPPYTVCWAIIYDSWVCI